MLYKEILAETMLDEVSDQIADFLPSLYWELDPQPRNIEMRQSFPVWALNIKELLKQPEPTNIAFLVSFTGYWHHQIWFDEIPGAHARSRSISLDVQQVTSVSISPLAAKIDAAMLWADRSVRENNLVRLLSLPSYLVSAFWLVESEQVYIIEALPSFTKLQLAESKRMRYADDFLRLLRGEILALDEEFR